jgi:hypothetical protein
VGGEKSRWYKNFSSLRRKRILSNKKFSSLQGESRFNGKGVFIELE